VEMEDTARPEGVFEEHGRPLLHPATPRPAAQSELEERMEAIEGELEEIFLELVAQRQAAAGLPQQPPTVSAAKLCLEIAPRGLARREGGQLYRQLQRAAELYVDRRAAIPLGRVYCHWCRSFFCEHSAPPEPRCVFGGYTPTGQPTWPEFVSVLLERRHPRVDSIFHGNPSLVTLVQWGGELTKAQLPVYGKRSPVCRILGQIAMGYIQFPDGLWLPNDAGGPRSPLAITLQAVEVGVHGHGAPLILNVVSKIPDDSPAYQVFEESRDTRLADALHASRQSLVEASLIRMSRRRRGGERQRLVMAALQRLAKNLDRIFRQRERRTFHSQERHANRGRPASTALGDALQAAPDSIYRDVEERTWVVLGPKNRVHVFNDQGRHVTSIVYPGETVRARTTRGKWRAPQEAERTAFQEALRRQSPAAAPPPP